MPTLIARVLAAPRTSPSEPTPSAGPAGGAAVTVAAPRRLAGLLGRLPDELGIFVAFMAIFVFLSLDTSTFLRQDNLLQIVRSSSFYGVMALGMTFALSLSEIDISIGSIYFLCAVIMTHFIAGGTNPWIAVAIGILAGAVLGLVNGGLSLIFGVPMLIVSLGALSLYRGAGIIVSGNQDIVLFDTGSSFFTIINAKLFGVVPVPVLIFLALAAGAHVVLRSTRFGYRIQAIGSNAEAAQLVGMRINLTRLQVATLLGASCGLAAAMYVGFFEASDSAVGGGSEVAVLSAVIIGGTALAGGSGTIVGTVLGVLVIATITSGIVQLGISADYSTAVTGAVILVAIGTDRLVRRRQLRPQRTRPVQAGAVAGADLDDDAETVPPAITPSSERSNGYAIDQNHGTGRPRAGVADRRLRLDRFGWHGRHHR